MSFKEWFKEHRKFIGILIITILFLAIALYISYTIYNVFTSPPTIDPSKLAQIDMSPIGSNNAIEFIQFGGVIGAIVLGIGTFHIIFFQEDEDVQLLIW
jgi:amino acid transporter